MFRSRPRAAKRSREESPRIEADAPDPAKGNRSAAKADSELRGLLGKASKLKKSWKNRVQAGGPLVISDKNATDDKELEESFNLFGKLIKKMVRRMQTKKYKRRHGGKKAGNNTTAQHEDSHKKKHVRKPAGKPAAAAKPVSAGARNGTSSSSQNVAAAAAEDSSDSTTTAAGAETTVDSADTTKKGKTSAGADYNLDTSPQAERYSESASCQESSYPVISCFSPSSSSNSCEKFAKLPAIIKLKAFLSYIFCVPSFKSEKNPDFPRRFDCLSHGLISIQIQKQMSTNLFYDWFK